MMGGRMTLPVEPVDQARLRFEAVFKNIEPFLPPPDDTVQATDIVVPASGQRIRVYKPSNASSALPVGLYIHSGGWYAGSIENEDFLCRNLAANSQIILFSPEYRLAPEYPFPSALNDVCAAYEFMSKDAPAFGGNTTQRFILGGSAGGNLTAAVGLKYATSANLRPSGLFVLNPATCEPSVLPTEYKARYTPELYVDAPMISNELAAQSRDIRALPPCYIVGCTKDPTHQEAIFFHEECRKQGVSAEFAEWQGMPHFFWVIPMLKKSQEFMNVLNEKLRAMIADTATKV